MRLPALVAAAVFVLPTVALAQSSPEHTVSFGVLAGGTLPSGHLSREVYDPAVHVGALAQVRTPLPWLGVRVEGGYRQFGLGRTEVTDETGKVIGSLHGSTRAMNGTVNVVLRLPGMRSGVQPYAIGGIGRSRWQTHLDASDVPLGVPSGLDTKPRPQWTFETNLGAGIDAPLGRAALFVEARYQRLGEELRFVPLSVGLRIR